MAFITHKQLLEYDTHHLKLHMDQCKKEHCIQKSVEYAIEMTCNFITGRIITSVTLVLVGITCVSLII
jgi:predicted metalloenzyme YecM